MMNQIKFIAEPEKLEVILQCVVNAPREMVFRIYNDAKLVPHWWGPSALSTKVDRMDVMPGGLWRFIQVNNEGTEFAFHGVYHDIIEPERITYTFEYEGMPGRVLLETITFEDMNGATLLTDQSIYQSIENRDDMLQAGMESGAIESIHRLTELIAGLH